MRPNCQKNGLESLVKKGLYSQIRAKGGIGLDLDAHFFEVFDFFIQQIFGQSVRGNAHPQHAAGFGQGLEYGNVIAFDR